MRPFIRFSSLLLLGGLILILPNLAQGQRFRANIVKAELGASFLDLGTLNQTLETEGYAPLNSAVFAFGFSATQFRGHLVYGAKLYNYMIAKANQNFQMASVGYHYGIPYVGAVLYRDEQDFQVYLTAGAGGGFANLKARPVGSQFHNNYRDFGLLLDGAIHVSTMFGEIPDENKGFELGASIGYLHSPEGAFLIDDFVPTEAGLPVSPAGLYFRVSLGMMSWH